MKEYFGVGLKYLAGAGSASRPDGVWYGTGVFSTMMLAAVFLPTIEASSFEPICHVGFPMGDLEKDKERLKEAWKTLYNEDIRATAVDEAMAKLDGVVEFYYWIKPYFLDGSVDQAAASRTLDKWSVTVRG